MIRQGNSVMGIMMQTMTHKKQKRKNEETLKTVKIRRDGTVLETTLKQKNCTRYREHQKE